ncbi:hypothetical protein PAECIP111892_03097 [Paenibacillus auburnensis]|uniref:DUF3502 domain-containing protein n=1 Tax=Paenibacillus auburnensis TaxID=2905649 RepID=A0ABN8GGE9_9BACL|nr:ABC transporter substrate-binding protein [Paenibacillus auburnensis]CAH1208366.1 hypothetical protein PAECIP111892_03097 [Paenibacillus auburnensis]
MKVSKKKSFLLLLTLLLTLSMAISACSGNNSKSNQSESTGKTNNSAATAETNVAGTETDIDTSKEVRLKMVMLGAKPADSQKVYDEINKKLKEKINATVEVEYLDWADWSQKYPIKFAANEDFDLIYTSNWAFYNDQATKGGFLELTEDLLKKYAPVAKANIPEVNWDQAKVNGKIYMIPNNHMEVVDKLSLIREDLRQKYNLPEVNSLESFATYLKTIAKNEKGVTAYSDAAGNGVVWHDLDLQTLFQLNNWRLLNYAVPIAFKADDPTGKLFNVIETPEYKDLLNYYKDLADNGVWPKNIINNKADIWPQVKSGKVSMITQNLLTLASNMAEAKRENANVNLKIVTLSPNAKTSAAIATQNGMGIHATSKNPERALMALDLFQNNKEIHDLVLLGIAGEHYKPEGDDKYSAGPMAANYGGYSTWGFNSNINRENLDTPKEALDMLNELKSRVYHYPLEKFVFDDTNVKNEISNINNVMIRYNAPLEYGAIENTNEGYAQLAKQLKTAGLEKVQQEMQSQIDAFLAAQ